tara:strand:- start:104 stop:307 length:204 start_codon:yes stop_codon:yes gene_type:complete
MTRFSLTGSSSACAIFSFLIASEMSLGLPKDSPVMVQFFFLVYGEPNSPVAISVVSFLAIEFLLLLS